MSQSQAYNDLINQVNATGMQKMDGYNPDILDEIYDNERDSAEDIIWKAFQDGDSGVSIFLPKLRKYNGIDELENSLLKCVIPSGRSIELARALYTYSKDEKYLDIFVANLQSNDESHRVTVLTKLMEFSPSDKIFEIFENSCLNDLSKIARSTAATGLLYCKGHIKNPFNIMEVMQKTTLKKLLTDDTVEERQKNINALRDEKLK